MKKLVAIGTIIATTLVLSAGHTYVAVEKPLPDPSPILSEEKPLPDPSPIKG